MPPFQLNATEAARKIREGELTSVELVQSCLDRIEEHEGTVGAWIHLDKDHALEQARIAHERRQAGEQLGPLHGIPVGVKDIFDTADMPTQCGSALYSGRTPTEDATAVALLRAAGAIILGKTVTTEFAFYSPGKTTNPHDPTRTPGGSSSGSAASVASFMAPLAVGSQTNGSVIRPASFCGVFGYKPSLGLISRHGVLKLSSQLDAMGAFARSLDDLALISECMMAYDANDAGMRPRSRPQISRLMTQEPPAAPRIAFVRSPVWDEAEESTKEAFRELCEHLGNHVDIVDLPSIFDEAVPDQGIIMATDMSRNLDKVYEAGKDKISPVLCELIEKGRTITAVDYCNAIERIDMYNAVLDHIMADYDFILTPATPGEAPVGLEATGSPIFNSIWSLCGVPALTLPILQGPAGMPLGAQIVSKRLDDARLFRNARWLLGQIEE
jgi:Asp-tRNA(Asn)/Glu-tRNA(Gln) amidotransferase A subunit family amidase